VAAASTIGKIQYPSTHTHWKNDMWPPNNFVLIVTINEPPHIIRKTIPNSLPFELIPMFKMLNKILTTEREGDIELVGPKDPLYKQEIYNFWVLLLLPDHFTYWIWGL